jgi:hypothetical protein
VSTGGKQFGIKASAPISIRLQISAQNIRKGGGAQAAFFGERNGGL